MFIRNYILYLFNIFNKIWLYLLSTSYINNNLLEFFLTNTLIYSSSNLYLIGDLLYNSYPFLLIYVGLILLFAMIGSIVLTVDSNYHNVQYKKVNNYYSTREMKNRITFWNIKKYIKVEK